MKNCLYLKDANGIIKHTEVNYNSVESHEAPLIVNVGSCVNTDVEAICHNKSGRLDYYLIYVIEGRLVAETDDGRAEINEGELFVIPPRRAYHYESFGKHIYYLCVHFTGSEALNKLKEYDIPLFPNVCSLSPNNNLQKRFRSLFEAFAKKDSFLEKELAILLERILIETSRAIKEKSNGLLLSRSIRFINEHYTDQIRIPELAKMEGMCMTLYNKLFKRQTGVAPTKYIMNLRIQHAIELLDTSNIQINEIGTMCGYNNFNFFSRIFKSCVGKSPSEYRKNPVR